MWNTLGRVGRSCGVLWEGLGVRVEFWVNVVNVRMAGRTCGILWEWLVIRVSIDWRFCFSMSLSLGGNSGRLTREM